MGLFYETEARKVFCEVGSLSHSIDRKLSSVMNLVDTQRARRFSVGKSLHAYLSFIMLPCCRCSRKSSMGRSMCGS